MYVFKLFLNKYYLFKHTFQSTNYDENSLLKVLNTLRTLRDCSGKRLLLKIRNDNYKKNDNNFACYRQQ